MSDDSNTLLSQSDRGVLKALADNGEISPETPRHTLLYFYPINDMSPEEDRLRATSTAAQFAERAGWRIVLQDATKLIIEDEQDVCAETVAERSLWANALAEETDLLFDAWECMVLTGDDVDES